MFDIYCRKWKKLNIYSAQNYIEREGLNYMILRRRKETFIRRIKNREWWQEKENAKHEKVSMRLIPQKEKTHSEKKKKNQRACSPNTGKLQRERKKSENLKHLIALRGVAQKFKEYQPHWIRMKVNRHTKLQFRTHSWQFMCI